MIRIQHTTLLALAGTLLILVSAMPAILQPVGPRSDVGREIVATPRAASNLNFLYTIGTTGVAGDNMGGCSERHRVPVCRGR
jgi:hypothetical protein